MPLSERRQAGAVGEIEITPEMIEAGIQEYLSHDSDDLLHTKPERILSWIYLAMAEVAP